MADSVPISTKSDSVEQETLISSWDEMIEKSLGNFGWVQLLQSILVSLAMFFDAQQSFVSIYTDAYPTWHCTTNHTTCSSVSDICKLPKSSWSWDGPSSMTIISHWGLECASTLITALPQSSFFMGCFLGSLLLATLADSSLGRKNTLFLSCLSMAVTSLVIGFSTNVWTYSALKFLAGFWRSSIGTCALVLLTEKVDKEWRFRVGILEYFCFAMGFMSLPAIAYVNRDSSWKSLYLWTSIPAICYSVVAYLFVTESPRWLLLQGREQEAMAVLKGISSAESGATATESLTANLLLKAPAKQKASIFHLYSSVAELLQKRWALRRIVAVMVLGFGIGMVYFGMPLGVGNLGFDIYLAVVFNALLEIPSYIATYLLENCRRKPSMLAFSVISGLCSVMCALIGNEVQGAKLGLALASFFSVCSAYDVFLLYAIELFPTSVRNTTTSLVRLATVFGAIFSPYLVSAGRKNDLFSYGVFGAVLMCSTISLVFLPETKGIALCDTLDQQEKKETILV